jgi:hypothetical protein
VLGLQESSFCTIGGVIGNYFAIPAIIDTATKPVLDESMEQPGHVIQRLGQRSTPILMPRNNTKFPFSTNLETYLTKAGVGVAATKHWLGAMLDGVMGASRGSTGTKTSGTGSTSTVLQVDDASTFVAGMAIAITNPTTNLLEMRAIKSVNTAATPDTITLKMALSFTPSTDDLPVYGGYTYALHNNPDGVEPTYLQFLALGYNHYDRWVLPGGTVESFKFQNMSPGGIPRIDFGWQFPTWLPADGANGTAALQGTTLPKQTYIDTVLSTFRDTFTYLRAYGSSALPASPLQCSELNIEPNIKYEQIRSPNGPFSSTVRGSRRIEVYPDPEVMVSFKAPAEDNADLDALQAASTELAFTQQFGATPSSGGVFIEVPRLWIKGKPQREDQGAIRCLSVQMYAADDTESSPAGGASALDTAIAQASIKLTFF